MPSKIEYQIDWGIDNDIDIIPANKWRDAKRLAKECREGLHPKINKITRVELVLFRMYDHDLQGHQEGWLIKKIKYKELYNGVDLTLSSWEDDTLG